MSRDAAPTWFDPARRRFLREMTKRTPSIDFAGDLRRLRMFNAKSKATSIPLAILALVIFLVPLRGANYRFNHPQALLMEPDSPDREPFNAWNSFFAGRIAPGHPPYKLSERGA
jgi:hypothetical protein